MIISPCSSRKKAPIDGHLHAATLTPGTLQAVVDQWQTSLLLAKKQQTSYTLYGGRAFTEAVSAARTFQVPHYIVSAGLGLIRTDDHIPSYAMTTVGSTDENVLKKCPPGTTAASWWKNAFPSGVLGELIEKAEGRVFVALPSAYLEMVKDELLSISSKDLEKIRILTAGRDTFKDCPLGMTVMPYDSRLDGPDSHLSGTKSDFASRALRHFVELIAKSCGGSLSDDKALVREVLADMRAPILPYRTRLSDDGIRRALIAEWQNVQGNRKKLLRHLRDELLVSCEQSRFARIAREVEEEGLV